LTVTCEVESCESGSSLDKRVKVGTDPGDLKTGADNLVEFYMLVILIALDVSST
jgi:hypothetical protein